MANVIHHSKNKGCSIFLNEEEKEQIRAVLGEICVDSSELYDLHNKIVTGCSGKFRVIDTRTGFSACLSIIKKQ